MTHSLVAASVLLPDQGPRGKAAARTIYRCDRIPEMLLGLSRLNVLIGPNNSGKSRLLRSLFTAENLILLPPGDEDSMAANLPDFVVALDKLIAWYSGSEQRLKGLQSARAATIHTGLRLSSSLSNFTPVSTLPNSDLNLPDARVPSFDEWNNDAAIQESYSYRHHIVGDFAQLSKEYEKRGGLQVRRVYIPAIRGIRSLAATKNDASDPYWDALARDYQWDVQYKDYVFTGQSMYRELRSRLLGDQAGRDSVRDFERFLGRVFFSGQTVTLNPRESKTDCECTVWVKVGGEELPIYDWGDGLQHVMIMTFPLFIYRDAPLMLFIEEPELYLHPGYQRIFIDEVLNDPDVTRQVFVATHSHQFLDITVDSTACTVFRLQKRLGDGTSQQSNVTIDVTRAAGPELEILADLGVRNSSVFLSNCTIWVEGITDRLYYRHFLHLYQSRPGAGPPFKEDLHFSFVEYGGENIEHWSFLDRDDRPKGIDVKRLCGPLLLIADKDDETNERKKERRTRLKAVLGKGFLPLPVREVENLLTPDSLKAVVTKRLPNVSINWPAFTHADYKNERLGKYLTKLLERAGARRGEQPIKTFSGDHGTIKEKVEFCHAVIETLTSWEDLSREAQKVTQRIYEFIRAKNPGPAGTNAAPVSPPRSKA